MSFGSGWTEEFCQPQLCGAEISLPESKKTRPNDNLRLSSAFRSVVRYSRCLLRLLCIHNSIKVKIEEPY